MAFFQFTRTSSPAGKHPLDQDKHHYQGFVLGLAFDSLRYADGQAAHYADQLEAGLPLPDDWVDRLIRGYSDADTGYGVLLDEREEVDLENLLRSDDISRRVARLREVETQYEAYFREQVAKRTDQVQEAFNEAATRTGFSMQHDALDKLEEALNQRDAAVLSRPVGLVRERVYPSAIQGFETVTLGAVVHYVTQNGGDKDQANEFWWITLWKLFDKIRKGPADARGYRWYDRGKESSETDEPAAKRQPAKMSTFFHRMATLGWLTERRKRTDQSTETIPEQQMPVDFIPDTTDPSATAALETAVSQLGQPCADIIRLHWIEGYSLEEVAEKLGRSYGNVRNLHPKCLQKLTDILKKIMNDGRR